MESKTPAPLTLNSVLTTQEPKSLLISNDRDPHDPVLRLLAELRDADPHTEAVLRSFKLPESAYHLTREEILESDTRSAGLAVSILRRLRDASSAPDPNRHQILQAIDRLENTARAQASAIANLRELVTALNLPAAQSYRCLCGLQCGGPLTLAEHQHRAHGGPVPEHILAAERHDPVLAELHSA